MDILNMLHIGGRDNETNITELFHFSAVKSCPANGCHVHLAGSLQTFITLGELPLALIPIATSPASPMVSSCSEKTTSKAESFAQAEKSGMLEARLISRNDGLPGRREFFRTPFPYATPKTSAVPELLPFPNEKTCFLLSLAFLKTSITAVMDDGDNRSRVLWRSFISF